MKQKPPEPPPSENGHRSSEEYDRFHDLTKRLLQVPKKAISEAEKRAKKGA